jgi:glycine/D-amino acid oxidase-like deaminating enzyme
MTPDHLPYVGPLTDRIWTVAGYNGHGSTVAPVLSRMIRDALIDGTPIFSPYDVRRLHLQ